MVSLFDKIFKKDTRYEQPYPNEAHKALLNLQKYLPDEDIKNHAFSMDYVKSMEKELPTFWMYKYVNEPLQFSYRYLALRSSMIGKYDVTINICTEGLNLFSDDPYLLYILGRTAYDKGRVTRDVILLQNAVNILNFTINLYPDFPDVYVERAKCNLLLNQLDQSEQDYLTAIELESMEEAIEGYKQEIERIRMLKNQDPMDDSL